jgi:hypothetical protein
MHNSLDKTARVKFLKSYPQALLYAAGWRPEVPNGSEQPNRRENQSDGGFPGQVQTVRDCPTGLYLSQKCCLLWNFTVTLI